MIAKQPFERGGETFAVPLGYASLEDYAAVVRLYYKNRDRMKMSSARVAEYAAEIAKLEKAGV